MWSTLGRIGSLALQGVRLLDEKTGGKFTKYIGGKALEYGARATKKVLDKANSDKANAVAKKVATVATEAAKEITGEDSDVTKNVTKAANIIAPGTATTTIQTIALPQLALVDNVPYSKRLYGSNFQRYEPKTIHKVKLIKRKHRGRVLQDINGI